MAQRPARAELKGDPNAIPTRGRWATTSTSPSARATCRPPAADGDRLRGDRQRRLRRAPAPRPADRGRGRPRDPATSTPARASVDDRPRPPHARSSTACTPPPTSPAAPRLDVFADFPRRDRRQDRHRRSGRRKADQSWYVALVPYPNPRIVVAVTVEQGGFGAESAAPAARMILAKLLASEGRAEGRPRQVTAVLEVEA